MRVMFRADASLQMGTGHIMRCLTLADALRAQGVDCQFFCREHPGNLIDLIRGKAYTVHVLPLLPEKAASALPGGASVALDELPYGYWLGTTQEQDAEACATILAALSPDWLIVDHYALDVRWEIMLKQHYRKLMVIDDLADRSHWCDLLLDQNLGRCPEDYRSLLPGHCQLLIGPSYALLRSEFAALRPTALARRQQPGVQDVLIALGGVDQHNYTGTIIDALKNSDLLPGVRLTVVLGATAPHLECVRASVSECLWPVEVLSGIDDMAERMMRADLAIGAGGGSAWERCCLGLPTLLVILAENQKSASYALAAMGAAILLDLELPLGAQLQSAFARLKDPSTLRLLTDAASRVTDGGGVEHILERMGVNRK